ncbi:MAG: hypothetical protein JXQ90_19805 [Cyclobacteriaceae bacterium]
MTKLAVTIGSLLFIVSALDDRWFEFDLNFSLSSSLVFVLCMLLVPLNWKLEAIKWKVLLKQFSTYENNALESVMKGLALNWLMPFSTGDIVARLSNSGNVVKTGKALLIGRTVSLTVTVGFGLIGIGTYLIRSDMTSIRVEYIYLGSVVVLGVLLLMEVVRKVSLITILRYLIFATQFTLLIKVFNPGLSVELIFRGVTWVLFIRTIVPGFLGAIGIREASALIFFQPLITHSSTILAPSLVIWILNMVLPSLLGFWFVWRSKNGI